MHISEIFLKDFHQFKDIYIDFSYPEGHPKAGQPLSKICLIGPNGTGKTILLNLIHQLYNAEMPTVSAAGLVKIVEGDKKFCVGPMGGFGTPSIFKSDTIAMMRNSTAGDFYQRILHQNQQHFMQGHEIKEIIKNWQNRNKKCLIFSPAESRINKFSQLGGMPSTNLSNALQYFTNFPYSHNISFDNLENFWNLVIYQIKKRESDKTTFMERPENAEKAYGELKSSFDAENPVFLERLAKLWNRILGKSGLYFDAELAKIPLQLTENLEAYVKLINGRKQLPYNQLSSGTRQFIFRLGYFAAIFFNRPIESGLALIDEPETSLFPDLLFDLVDEYVELASNTQFIFATHSPIIAAQFEPYERIILDFDETRNVITRRGVSGAGDDPNDVLRNDFGIPTLLGKEGRKKWARYVELRTLIRKETDEKQKNKLSAEFLEIGRMYNFGHEAN